MKNIAVIMLTQIALKVLYEVIVLPITAAYVRRIRNENNTTL